MSSHHLFQPISREDLRDLAACRLPLPGSGGTARRWDALAAIARRDLPLVKLVEPHHDAVAILSDLGGDAPRAGEIWGVWAAEPPFAVLKATETSAGWRLSGIKAFCSGASLVTHTLVTANTDEGSRMFAIDVASPGVRPGVDGPGWVGHGMERADTVSLALEDVPATPVGAPGGYTARPGFWFGAIGIAACWLGGARGVADTLERAKRLDAHGRAHLGAVRAQLDTLGLAMAAAADQVDRGGLSPAVAERLAYSLRARAADAAELVTTHVGRALGPGPLAFDADHSRRVADLQVFVRQHHAERDLERLGSLDGTDPAGGSDV